MPGKKDLSFLAKFEDGAIAQLGEQLLCKHQVQGSSPCSSILFSQENAERR